MVKKEDGNVGSNDPVRAILFLHFLQTAEKAQSAAFNYLNLLPTYV